jgi:hypothetical protein
LALALNLGSGDRSVIYQARDSRFFLTHDRAHPVGDVTLSCLAALSPPALFVAPVLRAGRRVLLLRRLFAVCLAAVAIGLLLRA